MNVNGLPVIWTTTFTPTIVFSTTPGTITYTTQTGSIRYIGIDYNIATKQPITTYTALVSVTLVFTFTGSTGNVSIGNIPISLPSISASALGRNAVMASAIGINTPNNTEGSPFVQFTYPSTSPITASITYLNTTGSAAINVNNTNMTAGATNQFSFQTVIAITTPPPF